MKKWKQMTWIWLCLLCFCGANQPLLADVLFTNWVPTLSVKEEDVVDIDKYRLPNDDDTLTLCLYKTVLGNSYYQRQCDEKVTIRKNEFSLLVGDLPTLEAKQICQKVSKKGQQWYIRAQQSEKAEYVVKCKGADQKKSVILSLNKLCQSQYAPLESDQEKFCPSSNGNCAELQAKVRRLEQELSETKAQLKKANAQLKNAKAKAQELTRTLETSKRCEIRTLNNNRITVAIKDYSLRFVKVKSTYRSGKKKGIRIALTEQQAYTFHRQATQLSRNSQPIYPNIFKAVSKEQVPKHVAKFWIQEQTIDPKLYKEIIRGGSADSVSYEDAMIVIETLNEWCKGKAKFKLPEEKQFVYLAREAYNPIKEGLQRCRVVKNRVALDRVKQLLGHQWQLTSSYCSSFFNRACNDDQTRIKKGGSSRSQYAAECLPEYRAESMPDIREPNTTFRLVLKPLKK